MKENKYNDLTFFNKYAQMDRSLKGLKGAGEWPTLKKMLPDMKDKNLLDLGCGYGWHCIYAKEQGAHNVCGVDISEKMLLEAKKKSKGYDIEYHCCAIEDMTFPKESFDIIISSLTFHYLDDLDIAIKKIKSILKKHGTFIFSCEHPVFTAYGSQDWIYDKDNKIDHFPIDHYFEEGKREANFLNEKVIKYHKTLTTYIQCLLNNGFLIKGFEEPKPTQQLIEEVPEMKDELRRPMMMIIACEKR